MEQASRESEPASAGEPTLRRSIGLWQMTLYAAGSMLGAGIYGLIGQVAGEMGSAIWLAFWRCCMIQLRREWGRFSNFSFRTPQRRISAYPARPSG